jgi:hypothetical protein
MESHPTPVVMLAVWFQMFIAHYFMAVFSVILYECKPMAFLIEQAGGLATDGHRRILDIVPKQIHERCPIWLGSCDDIKDLLKIFEKYPIHP